MTVSLTFGQLAVHGSGLPVMSIASHEEIATHASNTVSTTAGSAGQVVRICSDANIRVQIGATPVAGAASGARIPADGAEYFELADGDKVAVITSTA